MGIPTYVQGYPPDGSSLGQTKSTIRNNLDGTFLTVAVDHVNNNGQPGSQPPGYHTVIHEVSQTSVDTVNGYNQVFSGVPGTLVVNSSTTPSIPSNGDTQLYSLSGSGVLSQLTGSSSVNTGGYYFGYVWVAGILFQWGNKNGASGSVSFNVPFPNAAFNVQITCDNPTGKGSSVVSISNSGFVYDTNPVSARIWWFAIGN